MAIKDPHYPLKTLKGLARCIFFVDKCSLGLRRGSWSTLRDYACCRGRQIAKAPVVSVGRGRWMKALNLLEVRCRLH